MVTNIELAEERERIEKQLELLYNSDSTNKKEAYWNAIKRLESRLDEIDAAQG